MSTDGRAPDAGPAVASRRDRLRVETTLEIKNRSWAVLGTFGPAGLSLRAVARSMGMAASALYRYFPSRDDLLTALIIDGFDSLADALAHAHDRARADGRPADAVSSWRAVAHAYRRWALDHPAVFGLVFSSAIPDYAGTPETTAASLRSSAVMLGVMADLVGEGRLDAGAVDPRIPDGLRDRLSRWSVTDGRELPPAALAAAMWCYASLHGMVTLEVNGHLPPELSHDDELFESCIDAVVRTFTVDGASVPR